MSMSSSYFLLGKGDSSKPGDSRRGLVDWAIWEIDYPSMGRAESQNEPRIREAVPYGMKIRVAEAEQATISQP